MVAGVPGLEPRTTEPESAVLPITPYPIGSESLPNQDTTLSHGSGNRQTEIGPDQGDVDPVRHTGSLTGRNEQLLRAGRGDVTGGVDSGDTRLAVGANLQQAPAVAARHKVAQVVG